MSSDHDQPTPKRKITPNDITHLKSLLADTTAQVLAPIDKGYNATIERWSRAAEKPAGLSIVPRCAAEISPAIRYATQQSLDVAIKGGGPSTAGTSSTDGGLLFDLSAMRNVRVDPEKRLIYGQGGCLWGDVDSAAWEYGLATVGGTVADTGIGGMTLGGGYGHLTGKYGLALDNVVEIEVVVASGKIIRASEANEPDLFWGLLGAGQNFGVATEFVYRAYPQGNMFLGSLVFDSAPETVARVVAALNELYMVRQGSDGPYTNVRGRSDAELLVCRHPDTGDKTVLEVMATINDTAEHGRELFQALYDIGPIHDGMQTRSYPEGNAMHQVLMGFRSSMKGAGFTLPIRPAFVSKCVDSFTTFVTGTPDAASRSIVAWVLHDNVKLTASTVGSFANRGYHQNGVAIPSWTRQENDEVCRQWGRDIAVIFKDELERSGRESGKVTAGDGGVGVRGPLGALMLYGNYDQYGERAKDLFGVHLERLQDVKARYDPSNMFCKLLPVTPKARMIESG